MSSSGESSTVVDFRTQQEMIASVGDNVNLAPIQNQPDMQFHYLQPLAIVWKEDEGQSKWYLGFYIAGKHKDGCILIDHLTGDDSEWTQPRKDEVLEVDLDQIQPITVKGDCSRWEWLQYLNENCC